MQVRILLSAIFTMFLAAQNACSGEAAADARLFNLTGVRLQSEGKLAEACVEYRKAIQLSPSAPGYHNNLALALLALASKDPQKYAESEREAETAVRLKPDKASYRYNLGIILARQNKFEKAEPEFREAVKLDGMDPEFRYRLGQCLSKLSRLPDAEEQLKLALLVRPNENDYLILLGDIYLQQGKKEEALYQYRKATSEHPEAPIPADLKNKIDYLKQALGTR